MDKCAYENHKTTQGKIWHFLAHEESIQSYLVNALIVILIGKFLLFPVLGLALGTDFPVVAVISTSMTHNEKFDDWWINNGAWYEANGITKSQFDKFYKSNGFNKGDVFVVKKIPFDELKVGDIIVYNVAENTEPIIHRIIAISAANNTLQTKGDNNIAQIEFEKAISENQIEGKAVGWIPVLGWIKVIFITIAKLF
ncbi:MAG: signal peptidase I [DPANN group archaeon]|nr:signal peptidase I [DPANN group archaeon]